MGVFASAGSWLWMMSLHLLSKEDTCARVCPLLSMSVHVRDLTRVVPSPRCRRDACAACHSLWSRASTESTRETWLPLPSFARLETLQCLCVCVCVYVCVCVCVCVASRGNQPVNTTTATNNDNDNDNDNDSDNDNDNDNKNPQLALRSLSLHMTSQPTL
jgi:hypothetical protein